MNPITEDDRQSPTPKIFQKRPKRSLLRSLLLDTITRIIDVAKALTGKKDLPIVLTSIRLDKKVHDIMMSEEECFRMFERDKYYVISPIFPKL